MNHFLFGLVLPSYIIDSRVSFLAHTDLSISNILVDPSDGTLTGIIDWEFANALPSQTVEHYPGFLANRTDFVELFQDLIEDPNAELDYWGAHYNSQFIDRPEISVFNNRIDAIFDFEFLLRLSRIADELEGLKAANALTDALPDMPWLAHLLGEKSPSSHTTSGVNTNGGLCPLPPSSPTSESHPTSALRKERNSSDSSDQVTQETSQF